jgi:cell wall-associated NlpC family hydrolase
VFLFLFLLPCLPIGAEARVDPRLSSPGGTDTDFLAAFSEASTDWGSGIEAVIEEAYQECFRTYIIAGKVMTLHLPFAENNERSELAGRNLAVPWGGKGDPLGIWDQIDILIASPDFTRYAEALSDNREKIVIFDLATRSWSTTKDWYAIDQMKAGVYQGLPHQPRVLTKARGITPPDIYNYLYSVGRLGVDCSGFVWYVLTSVARAGGLDLNKALARYLGAPRPSSAAWYIGTWFFDPRNRNLEVVKDEVRNLRPADVLVFRGEDGTTSHSAVIQSVDMARGTIRYLQSTDVAGQNDRGVHESLITFDPRTPAVSLRDPAVVWHQRRSAPFPGEAGGDFQDDGQRYRAWPELGGGAIVRLKMMRKLVEGSLTRAAK